MGISQAEDEANQVMIEQAINMLAEICWQSAEDKGFHEPKVREEGQAARDATAGERMMLIVSEVSEMLEAYRRSHRPGDHYIEADGKPEGVGVELADVIIRCLDYAGIYNIPIGELIFLKLAYNAGRPYMHGNRAI